MVFRLIERNEGIKILEVEKCREIFNHQNRLQLFFPKQNICAGRSNTITSNIKIVRKVENIYFGSFFLFIKINIFFLRNRTVHL